MIVKAMSLNILINFNGIIAIYQQYEFFNPPRKDDI